MPIIVSVLIVFILSFYNVSIAVRACVVGLFLAIYIFINLKRGVICAVKIYQHFAPETLRNKCRFEPSCSEYMILAIEKYGLLKGIKKGICRLKRCNTDNGGFDFP
ncbi:MAG: membrane protein insertion efficiency factor YidD [Acutalibacteraceae bacterium]